MNRGDLRLLTTAMPVFVPEHANDNIPRRLQGLDLLRVAQAVGKLGRATRKKAEKTGRDVLGRKFR